jgi:alkanesulfonate monooxygenase SsuD/methylene tetrahydromethanopterin reductase-like flavin-dependent oxidoreductase (luciferase family)
MFEESVDLITQLLTSEDTTFDGRHHHVDAPVTVLPRPTQTPHPPIWLASVSPESTRFAVTRGFHFMGLALATPAELAGQWRTIEDIARETGQSVTGRQYSANRYVYCTTDPDGRRMAAREAARQMAMSRALAKGAAPVHGVAPAPAEIDPADEELAYERLLAGTPDEIVAQIEQIADRTDNLAPAGRLRDRQARHGPAIQRLEAVERAVHCVLGDKLASGRAHAGACLWIVEQLA